MTDPTPQRPHERTPDADAAATPAARGDWRATVERTVAGLGYELVDIERSARGLLRVTIDRLPGRAYPSGDEFVTVEDCEAVTRQLQYVLEVDGLAYERLEVSSPGLDRPLKRAEHYLRFAGSEISVTLKQPFQGRKVWKGRLAAPAASAGDGAPAGAAEASVAAGPDTASWTLVFHDGKAEQVLSFSLDEVREARLVPVVDFKGRRGRQGGAAGQEVDGGLKR